MITEQELQSKNIKTIVAHSDIDGIASAAIAFKKFPSANIVFTEPTAVNDIVPSLPKPLLVLDLSDVRPAEDTFVIDHHPCEITGANSNTELLRDWSTATPYLVQLGQAGDQSPVTLPKQVRDDTKNIYLLLGYMSTLEADNLRLKLVYELSKGTEIWQIPEVNATLEQNMPKIKEVIDKITSEVEKRIEPYKDAIIVVYPDIPPGYTGLIANLLKNRAFTIFVIWRSHSNGATVVTIRTAIRNTVEFIRGIQEKDMGFICGGGHGKAGSFSTKTEAQEIKKLIIELLDAS